jgi:hypothetical protein
MERTRQIGRSEAAGGTQHQSRREAGHVLREIARDDAVKPQVPTRSDPLASVHPTRPSPNAAAVNIRTADRTNQADIERDSPCLDSVFEPCWAGRYEQREDRQLRCARLQLTAVSLS